MSQSHSTSTQSVMQWSSKQLRILETCLSSLISLLLKNFLTTFSKSCMTSTEILPAVTVGHFNPSWVVKVVRGTVFEFFEYMGGILQVLAGEAVDEEEVEEGYLVFGTGAGALETIGVGTVESGMGTDVCASLVVTLRMWTLEVWGAKIPCIHCE